MFSGIIVDGLSLNHMPDRSMYKGTSWSRCLAVTCCPTPTFLSFSHAHFATSVKFLKLQPELFTFILNFSAEGYGICCLTTVWLYGGMFELLTTAPEVRN